MRRGGRGQKRPSSKSPIVGIVMGSRSDLPTMREAALALKQFKISYEVHVRSAHRTPRAMIEYAASARRRGFRLIIAGAGGAAHLPGMVAAVTELPVIGVPVSSSTLHGLDSLLSVVQMPKGVPVATVAVGQAFNAGLLAAQILGASDESILDRVRRYKDKVQREIARVRVKA